MDIKYDKNAGKTLEDSVPVIDLEINGKTFEMSVELYNENIEAGRTKFVESGDNLFMVTPEQYLDLQKALEWIKNK